MKILIAYDGSDSAERALDDLRLAGLPDKCEAAVISVTEVWLPPTAPTEAEIIDNAHELQSSHDLTQHFAKNSRPIGESENWAHHAQTQLQKIFPNWQVRAEAAWGSPAQEILAKARMFQPDLIVVGSHGRTAVGRLFLGSISQKVMTESEWPVRVARGKIEVDPLPVRIIIGYDGTTGADAAVAAVAARQWREHSEVRLVTAIDSLVPTAIGRFVSPIVNWTEEELKIEQQLFERMAESALRRLRNAGLDATHSIETGNPKHLLVETAHRWQANCIFVGANAHGRIERFLLGSVSAAVAARAHCSVEIARTS